MLQGTLGPARAPYAFTTRAGGASEGAWASLNLALHVADVRPHVRANRARALEAMGRGHTAFVAVKQVHGDTVVEVTAQASAHIEADALVTRDAAATLAVLVADCVPVLLADAQGRAVACAHAGWRGTQARIAATAALALGRVAGCTPDALWATLGPAIGPCCFEVDAPVALALQSAFPEQADAFAPQGDAGRCRVDLWALNEAALTHVGLPLAQISTHRICTSCSPEHYSHRRDGAPSGRQAGLIGRPS